MRRLLLVALVACSSPAAQVAKVSPGPTGEGPKAAEPEPPQTPDLRLPGDVRPKSYELDLTVVPENERVVGRVKIDAQVVRPTRVVWLNATGLDVKSARLAGGVARVIPGGEDFVGLVADRELQAGSVAIDVAWEVPFERGKSRGIYTEKEGDKLYAYTFFEPIDARRAFPCFDEPNYKVPWKLVFHVRRDHVALANAPVAKETDEANDMKRVELAPSKPLPAYLVAFVVGPFEVVDGGVAGRAKTPVRFVVPQGRAGELGWAKKVTPPVVAALEDYFDMPYPYGKLDVAVVPRFWGTMEHPGIVAMGQPLTLIRPEQETRARKQRYANILAHELSHYWFGDYVTMAWWDDTWLNEALGEWLDMIITNAVEPAWRYPDRRPGISMWAMNDDEQLATHAIRVPVETKTAIEGSFDNSITYAKGSSVLRMFEAWVGPDRWRDFIRQYVRDHAWGNASAEDLLRAVRTSFGKDNEAALRDFLDQPGVPRISADKCAPGGTGITLHQSRALPPGVTDPAPKKWRVPVCARFGDEKSSARACNMIDGETGELRLAGAKTSTGGEWKGCPTWIILNAGATGYYRSAVDPAVAKALLTPGSAIAKAAQPTAAEKLMLLGDLRAAVERDELQLDKLLELAPLVAADPDERVAGASLEAASFVTDPLDDALYAKAQQYFLRSYGPVAKKLGWARAKTDSDERHDLRRQLVGLVAHVDAGFAKTAEPLADKWLAERKGLEDDLVDTALSAATRWGNRARFDALLEAARAPRDRTEQQRLLGALGGFRDPAIVKDALALVLATEFDLRDSRGIAYRLIEGRETREQATAWLEAHLDELLARMRDDEATGFLGFLAELGCTPEYRKRMEALVAPRAAKYQGAQVAVTRGLEKSQQCIASFARQLPAIKRFLAK